MAWSWPQGTLSPDVPTIHERKSRPCKTQMLLWSSHRNLTHYALKEKRAAQAQQLEKHGTVIYTLLYCRSLLFCHLPFWKHRLVPGPDVSASIFFFSILNSFCLHWNLQLGGTAYKLVQKANFGTKQRQQHLLPSWTACWPSSVTEGSAKQLICFPTSLVCL